jgi:hypothetical protein
MRTRRRATIEDLRLAIDCLPRHTRIAMLHGIETNPIIVGAYSNSDGICPMLAAHRGGGRTSLIAFAGAWDRVAFRGVRKPCARRASERELLILRSHLEASLLSDEAPSGELATARREHLDLIARHESEKPAPAPAAPKRRSTGRPGDPNRAPQLRHSHGWSWSRIVRRLDDYETLLDRIGQAPEAPAASGSVPVSSSRPR